MTGAAAVSVGTASSYNPYAAFAIAEGIKTYMKKLQAADMFDLIVCVK